MLCQQILNDTAWFARGPECSGPQVNKLLRHASRPRHAATPLVPASAARSLQAHPSGPPTGLSVFLPQADIFSKHHACNVKLGRSNLLFNLDSFVDA